MKNGVKMTLGLLGAVAAGVIIGLMVAPEKGSETRARIKRTTGSWVDQLGNILSTGRDAAEENIRKVKESMG